MGGDRVRMKLHNFGEFHKDLLVWNIYVKGGLAPLME